MFRTGDYGTDTLAMQAGVDAAVDFRGDVLFLTPGSYNPLTAVLINADGLRVLGPPIRNVARTRTTVTSVGGVTNTFDIPTGVDNIEIGFLRFVPVTAGNSIRISNSDDFYAHHLFWDTTGVATSVSTKGLVFQTATNLHPQISDSYFFVDVAQGEAIDATQTSNLFLERSRFISDASTWARAILTAGTTLYGHADMCHFGGRGLITTLVVGATGADQWMMTRCYMNPDAYTNIETGFDATLAIQLAECYNTGDAATQGGTLTVLA